MKFQKIVVLAHDQLKPKLAAFLKEHEQWLWGKQIIATGRSAETLEEADIDLEIRHLSRGREGGYGQITEMIEKNEIDLLIFFQDPEIHEAYHVDIRKLLHAANRNNLALATNSNSAELLMIGIIKKEYAERKKGH